MDALDWLRKQLEAEGSDLLREMVLLSGRGEAADGRRDGCVVQRRLR
jgi:hypothetical protein